MHLVQIVRGDERRVAVVREPELVLLPEDDEPRDDFEPALDDFEDPPDLDPDADLFDEDPPERPCNVG